MSSLSHAHVPIPAVQPQPRRRHAAEASVAAPTSPWRSPGAPRTVSADGPRRLLFRTLLRRAEGATVAFPDGSSGVVTAVVLPPLGFDFWAEALVVAAPDGRHRVPVSAVRRVDTRRARIEVEEVRR